MDIFFIYLPIAKVTVFYPALILIGFVIGVLSGFFGVGGAWLATPALNALGLPMIYAVGTDIAHVGIKSIVGAYRHAKLGHVDFKLGLIMIPGSILGVHLGVDIVAYLNSFGDLDPILRISYLILLAGISVVFLYDLYIMRKKGDKAKQGLVWHKAVHDLRIPPHAHFKTSGITCSIWLPFLLSFVTGVMSSFLGIGGGLFRFPALIYLFGCSGPIAVGTDLFEVVISGIYGGTIFSLKGFVDYVALGFMLSGAVIGAYSGANVTKHLSPFKMRVFFLIMLVVCFVSIALKEMGYSMPALILILSGSFVISAALIGSLFFKKQKSR